MVTKQEQVSGSKVQSIDRAVSILEALAEVSSISLNELSKEVGLHKATTHRIIHALIENGLVEQLPETKQYQLSLKLFELGNKRVQQVDFLNVAKSNIRQLSQEIGHTVHLVVEDHDQVLYIDKYGDFNEPKMRSKIGSKAPLYCTAVGKIILADRSENELTDYWDHITPVAKTPNTITDFARFQDEIEAVKHQGFAIDDEEFENGIFCIGSAFSSYKEPVAGAISISLPISEKPNEAYYADKVLATAEKITQLLGGIWKYEGE